MTNDRGWIVLTGRSGSPVRTDDDITDMDVAWFPDREAACAWIDEHPRVQSAHPAKLRGADVAK